MALKLSARYPGQTVAPSSAYPQGSARDVSVSGDGTGTPWQKDLVNDWLGFFQSLIDVAGFTPTEVPDQVGASQYFDALLAMITSRTDQILAVFTPLKFGGVGDGVADDTAAVQDCFDAAFAAVDGGCTTVDLGGKTWRVTATLACYPHVHLRNGTILHDHASATALQFGTASTEETFAEWTDVELRCDQAHSGILLDVSFAARVRFARCRFNEGSNCTGRFYRNTAAANVIFDDCTVNIPVNNPGFRSDVGRLTVRGGRLITPSTYADNVVSGISGEHYFEGVHFDLSATTGGNAACIQIAGQEVFAYNNEFDDGNNNGNVAFTSALSANTAKLTARGNKYTGDDGSVGMQPFDLAGYLMLGSSAEGLPHVVTATTDENIAVRTDAQTISLRSARASTTPATLTFDDPIYAGQVLHVLLGNDHTSAWSGNIVIANASYDDADTALANLLANSTSFFCATLVAHRYEGSLNWVVTHMNQVVLV